MLIGIDWRAFYGAHAGTGRYVTELCRVLDAALPEASFLVCGNRPLDLPVYNSLLPKRGRAAELIFHPSTWSGAASCMLFHGGTESRTAAVRRALKAEGEQ